LNNRAVVFLKNFMYTITSNLVSLVVSSLIIIIVPKLIGIEEYGYWQMYLFYSAYVGFLHFGWNDGIYLRFGGKEYKDLDKSLFFSQFLMLTIFQFFIALITFVAIAFSVADANKIFVFQMTAICIVIVNVRNMLLYILQATNRFKNYAQITLIDRILYCGLIIIFLLVGIREYKLMIIADLVGKFLSLLFAMYCGSDVVFRKFTDFRFGFKETIANISVGIKLMFANIASMLIIGVVRFGIEHSWNVETFGKVSLTLSISNLMILFVDAAGIIMFPILRKTDTKVLPKIYVTMRELLMAVLFFALIIYYPLKVLLSSWLPQYADSIVYMALIFPMCVYEGKMALLINTYLKTLRKEKMMLKINILTLALSLIMTFISTIILKNLDFAVISIIILLSFRCAIAEIYLSSILKTSVYKEIIMELLMTLIFILSGWFLDALAGELMYLAVYLIYLLIKKNDIKESVMKFKLLIAA